MELKDAVQAAYSQLHVDAKLQEIAAIDLQLSDSEVWSNPDKAQVLARQAAALRAATDAWVMMRLQLTDLCELVETGDESLHEELQAQVTTLEDQYQTLRKDLLFSGAYDDHGAIIKISAGAGGTDAQDWAEMLERMYLRWAEKSDMGTELIERSAGEEAGIKSATYSLVGVFAYGKLRSEHGVHRLVRLSPFNADNLRQTSFALVEVMPQIDAPSEVAIDEKDLKIDVYRAGGHGGQSVNTTDSAARVSTRLIVPCESRMCLPVLW